MGRGRPPKPTAFGEGWYERTEGEAKRQQEKLEKLSEENVPTEEEAKMANEAIEASTGGVIDLEKIADVNYLNDIFSAKYDNYGSQSYMEKIREKLLKLNYPETPLFNTMIFLSVILRRLQIVYQEHHVILKEKYHHQRPEDLELLEHIRDISSQLGTLQKTMDVAVLRRKQTEDVFSLHEEMMKAAERNIEAHVGEHTFLCENCQTIVNTQGLEHWAIRTELHPGDSPIYHVFSPEMWQLVRLGVMPLHLMAFCLRTSIEGVLITAQARKEHWIPKLLQKEIEEEEKKLMELRRPYDSKVEKEQQIANEALRA